MIVSAWKCVKYFLIVAESTITGKSCIRLFGSTYIVSGKVVKKL